MIEDKSNMRPPFAGDVDALDTAEQALVGALRAPAPLGDGAFDARVMAAVRRERAHGAAVSTRRYGRIAGFITVGAALAASLALIVSNGRSTRTAPHVAVTPVAVTRAPHTVRFTLVATGASHVTVAGSFNGWNTASTPLRRVDRDTWTADIPLSAGRYVYQFVIDGSRWVPDPRAPRDAGDDFGVTNSVVTVPTYGSA